MAERATTFENGVISISCILGKTRSDNDRLDIQFLHFDFASRKLRRSLPFRRRSPKSFVTFSASHDGNTSVIDQDFYLAFLR